MKLKTLLIVLLLSLFFMGTQSSAMESHDMSIITYEASMEVHEQVEEIEDNRNFLLPTLLLSYFTINSNTIHYEPSFFLRDNLTDIEKPPIIS